MEEVIRILCGSHLYGTTVPESDKDYKVIFIPEGRDILLGQVKNECTKEGDDDAEYMSLQQYLKLLCEGQTNALDMLFAPKSFYVGEPGPAWYSIQANQERFISKTAESFVGYCRTQAGKYAVKLERFQALEEIVNLLRRHLYANRVGEVDYLGSLVEDNPHMEWEDKSTPSGGTIRHLSVCQTMVPITASVKTALETYEHKLARYGERVRAAQDMDEDDWKSMYHAVRVAYEAIELLETGKITLPRPERNLLLTIRLGKIPFEKVSEMIEGNLLKVEQAVRQSQLPDEPDWNFADSLTAHFYRSAVCRYS